MNFSAILRNLRGQQTQEEVAKAIGITKSSWAMYERGECVPRDEVKVKIAQYFGVPVQDIFFREASTKSVHTRER